MNLQRLRDEDGISAVIVCVCLVGILGTAMLAIDSGSLWRQRRAVITDADAGALAAARYIDANGADACRAAMAGGTGSPAGQEAQFVMKTNTPKISFEDFSVFPYQGDCAKEAGHVRVGARLPVSLAFAPVFGIKNASAYAASFAQYGPLITATGMRPVGICDKSEHFVEWKNYLNGNTSGWGSPATTHPAYGGTGVVHRINFGRAPTACGRATGNWAFLDYNGTTPPNGAEMLVEWFRSGYQGEVSLGDSATGKPRDCNPEENGNQDGCAPQTGARGGSLEDVLRELRDTRKVVPIAVYDRVVDDRDPQGCNSSEWGGSGNNARFCFVGILLVRIHGWSNITGHLDERSRLDLEFVDQWWIGSVGRPKTDTPTVHGVQLCGGNYGTNVDDKCDV